jgi:hypothetical protein
MTPQEEINAAAVGALSAAAERYVSGSISAVDFVDELTPRLTDDVEFWSNYRPTWEPLRPLFSERHGVEGIVARYDYEHRHEAIEPGSAIPTDIAIAGDVMYLTQRETARFFGGDAVTWDMVIRIEFRAGLIAKLQMFLDSAPIEAAYGTDG